jgi:hypothetical protein
MRMAAKWHKRIKSFLKEKESCRKCAGMDALAIALCCIQRRPTMWLPNVDSLAEVEAFITGYRYGQRWEGRSHWFSSFTNWVGVQYGVNPGPMNGFSLIRERVGNDEKKGWDEFFRLLPKYMRDMERLGPDGISKKFEKLVHRLYSEQFRLAREAVYKERARKSENCDGCPAPRMVRILD